MKSGGGKEQINLPKYALCSQNSATTANTQDSFNMKWHLGNSSAFVILCVAVFIDNLWSVKSAGNIVLEIQLFTAFCTQVVHLNTLSCYLSTYICFLIDHIRQ